MLVNNAGVMPLSPLDKLKVDEWDRTIDVNIKGVLYGIAAVLPRMQAQGSGHIVNVASIAGLKVFTPIGTVYSATKHAVRAISEGLRVEVGGGGQQRRARVTIVSPGAVESELKFGSTDAEHRRGREGLLRGQPRSPPIPWRARWSMRWSSRRTWTSTRSCCGRCRRSSIRDSGRRPPPAAAAACHRGANEGGSLSASGLLAQQVGASLDSNSIFVVAPAGVQGSGQLLCSEAGR